MFLSFLKFTLVMSALDCAANVKSRVVWVDLRIVALPVLLCLWSAHEPLAEEVSGFMVRGGPVWLEADNVKGKLEFAGAPLSGDSLRIEEEVHQGLLLTWMMSQKISIETVISTPLDIGINIGGGVLGNEFRAGQVDVLPVEELIFPEKGNTVAHL